MRLLVVEDEPKLADVLRRGLEGQAYAVDIAATGAEALWMATEWEYGCIVLDVGIPPPDGFEVCRLLRARGRWAPILLLTIRDAVEDRVKGLDAGADDYLTKPFSFIELLARVRALTRRAPEVRPPVLRCDDICLDPATHEVTRAGQHVELSPKEFALLEFLMNHADEALTRTAIIDGVWDFAYDGTSNVVDVYIRYLRDKVDRPFGKESIETIWGVGYRLRSGSMR